MGIEKVSLLNLFIVYCLIKRRLANLATIMISPFTWPRGTSNGSYIAMGTCIGRLAESLGMFVDYPRKNLSDDVTAARFRFEDVQHMGLCTYDQSPNFFPSPPLEPVPPPAGLAPIDVPVVGAPPSRQDRPRARAVYRRHPRPHMTAYTPSFKPYMRSDSPRFWI